MNLKTCKVFLAKINKTKWLLKSFLFRKPYGNYALTGFWKVLERIPCFPRLKWAGRYGSRLKIWEIQTSYWTTLPEKFPRILKTNWFSDLRHYAVSSSELWRTISNQWSLFCARTGEISLQSTNKEGISQGNEMLRNIINHDFEFLT